MDVAIVTLLLTILPVAVVWTALRESKRISLTTITALIVPDKSRADFPHLSPSLSAGTTLLRIPCGCLWPKAVIAHGYMFIVLYVEKCME